MKIDVEGSEFPIFDSIKSADLIEKIDAIVMEYHRDPKELLGILRAKNFLCICTGNLHIGMIYAINMSINAGD